MIVLTEKLHKTERKLKWQVPVYPLIGVILVSYGKTLPSLPDKKVVASPWFLGGGFLVGTSKRALEREACGLRVFRLKRTLGHRFV